MPKPLAVNAPYPTTDDISPDYFSLKIISPAYASSSSELNAILQYLFHSQHFKAKGYDQIAEDIESIAITEMRHLKLLGETILALGASPIYTQNPSVAFNFYSAKFVSYSTAPVCMVEDDICGEMQAIKHYSKMASILKNDKVKAIINRIKEDEELHLEKLKQILSTLKG